MWFADGFKGRKNDPGIQAGCWLTIFIVSIYSIAIGSANGSTTNIYSENDLIFGKSYDAWVARYWNYLANETQDFTKQIKEGGCYIHQEDSVIMLMDPVVKGSRNQVCNIPSDRAILINIWSGECDAAMPENEGASFEQIAECARKLDLGKVRGEVKVDGITIARLDVSDYTTITNINATEIYSEFDITLPTHTRVPTEKFGTFPAAAHGWFVFLKPLPPGDHTIYLENIVRSSTLSGAVPPNTAQITYHFNVGQ